MRKLVVLSMITLDNVMQGPGSPGEDTSEGFKYGGWVAPFDDEVSSKALEKELQPAEYLLGRKTFEIWEGYWRKHADYWPGINEGKKYVLSNSRNSSDWKHTTFLQSVEDIKTIKKAQGLDLHVWGSSELVQLLLTHDLVDELRLKIHPLLLGNGKKLFDNAASPSSFELMDSAVTSKGVILANYKRKGEVRTGIAGAA